MANHIRLLFGAKLLKDRTGLISSGFIIFIWMYGHIAVFFPILIPQYKDGNISVITISVYMIMSAITIFAYFRSMFSDPGKIANVKMDKIDWRTWEKCARCCMARPPRSHHCRRCGYCVLNMDHHCQWINNCVGKKNFWIFYMLLFYAFCFVNLNIALYHFHKWSWLGDCISCQEVTWINPMVNPMKAISYFIAALAFIGITLLLLLTGMHISIGMSTIESLENPDETVKKVLKEGKLIPRYKMLTSLCGTKNALLWFIPCRMGWKDPNENVEMQVI